MSKEGIGYFSFDTDFFHSDKKVKLIKSEFGSKGVVILIYTLCVIYSDKGYYMKWGEDDCYLASEDLGCDCSPNLIGEVINRCIKRGIFNEEVFNAFGVLTSHGIQIRFLKAASKRERIKIIEEYALFDLDELKEGMRNKVAFFSYKGSSYIQKVASSNEKDTSSNESKEIKESKNTCVTCASRFNDFFQAYPKQKNMIAAEKEYMLLLFNDQSLDEQELVNASVNYAEAMSILGTEERYIKNPDRFLSEGRYVDYLDANYKKPDPPKKSKSAKNKFNDFTQREYDMGALERELLGYGLSNMNETNHEKGD